MRLGLTHTDYYIEDRQLLRAYYIADKHDGILTHTHLEPDILECKVGWALGSISLQTKLVEVMEFQFSYFIS